MGLKDYFSGMFKRPSYSNGDLYDEDEEDDDFDEDEEEDEEDDDFYDNEEDDNFENDEDEFQNDDFQDEDDYDDGYGEDQNFGEDNFQNESNLGKDDKKDGIKEKISEIKSEINQVKDNINFIKERKQNAIRNDCLSIMPIDLVCPICKKKSLYCEKVGKMTSRGFSYFLKTSCGIADSYEKVFRYRCVNRKCNSYFNRTGDTFYYSSVEKKLIPVKNHFFIPKE